MNSKVLSAGILAALTFCSFSCKSLPVYTEHYLECEGAPLALEDQPESNNVNGIFPDAIYIKTLTQTFSFDYEYLLNDGKIYYKRRGTSANSWELFKATGLPYSEKNDFEPVNRIVEINADADVLYAFSDEGKLYRCYTKQITHYTPFEWIDYFGWPKKIQLYQNSVLKNKKTWAVGSSRKDVEYYTDNLGNEHNYGPLGVESIPFLCQDGQTIHYCDPACPSDFSHSFKGPEDGSFVAENLSESASTFFLISKDGTMYTRLMDYNTVGSDPMLYDYSYDEVYSALAGSNPASNTSTWALPNEPWKKEPALPAGAKGTTYITIIQTGKGNDQRELRVGAINPAGETGFYHKKITETSWQFTAAPLKFSEDSFTNKALPAQKPVELLQHYSGGLWKNGKLVEDVKCSVDNFHFSEGPFTLKFEDSDFKVDFYFSEVWTIFLRLEPGLQEEPIRYFGTAVYNREDFTKCNNRTVKYIFGSRNKAIHTFQIEAFDTYLKISLQQENDLYEFYLTENGNIKKNPAIDRKILQKNVQLNERIKNQEPYYEDLEDFYHTEKKINKKEKKTAAHLRAAVNTRKGKKHPVIKLISEKAAIVLQYSGEICKINKDYYKENYKLNKKYTKYLCQYSKCMEKHPDFDLQAALKLYAAKQKNLEGYEIIFFDEVPYYPAFIVVKGSKYYLYELDDSFNELYSYWKRYQKGVDFDHSKFKVK